MAKATKKDVSSAEIFGGPTKRFFVSMLPRDIKLEDALLDLLDNSIDGAMRQRRNKLQQKAPFKGFYSKLTLSAGGFEITDNCGGIPESLVDAAFSLGRPSIDQDSDLPTIGMYGIGMKRALFKIGKEALVQSNSKDGFFEVLYSKEWLRPDNDNWQLQIGREKKHKGDNGVTVQITDVQKEVAKQFGNESFANKLKNEIAEHFGYLIQRGFSIIVNGEEIKPRTLQLKYQRDMGKDGIRPFDYEATIDGVHVKVTVGFYRSLIRQAEIDEELDGPREKEVGGVSVVCNDRVILLGDTSMKTGWGDGGVPKYHPQFRTISGVVVFSSSDASKLPISTTKRDLDVGSDVYLKARKALIEGIKTHTVFTNQWKGQEEETEQFFNVSRSDAKTGVTLAVDAGKPVRGQRDSKKYVPTLPLPKSKDPMRRISFLRSQSKVKLVSEYLFEDAEQSPSLVGEECFDLFLEEAEKE